MLSINDPKFDTRDGVFVCMATSSSRACLPVQHIY